MSLFKKTIVITNGTTLGYASIVAIGSTVGVKIATKTVEPNMHAVVKLKEAHYFDMNTATIEEEVKTHPFDSDAITVLLLSNNTIIGRGGKRDKALEIEAQAKYTKIEFSDVSAPQEEKEVPQTADIEGEKFEFFSAQTDKNFYISIIDKMDEMMTIYPPDDVLDGLIEGGKFVKVQYDQEESYSVGTISVDGKVRYIVYAVEGLKSVLPPEETREVADFVPVDGDKGYWVIMQDGDTGEAVKIEE